MSTMTRPLSPHIQIYRKQITSSLSILHRATGVFLSIGTFAFVYWLWSLAAGPDSYGNTQAFFGSIIGRLILLAWVFSLAYHLSNGLRHLFWDAGKGFEIKTVYASGKAVLVVSVLLTVLVFIAAYVMRGGMV
uniref:Succinate dehydrogenase cytochrome b556 subunit n=1 Tax=Candidatus Kentrum sp. TUN TaxID=2126343 RepID=A0A450ZA01_9GAMM|nr:MAG: succinate dehydrogenase subunit C [Candidatus Kentron sp. TUN]VFK51749.1 MAG: succinate dehydrogenase subunit C [Candidatus Kentron sp. TUN]VFK56615.1 MAG: succinate dehydrogenase subunit C [Candidatus Kentron sp. TUN]